MDLLTVDEESADMRIPRRADHGRSALLLRLMRRRST
jgi:hypothetical protein